MPYDATAKAAGLDSIAGVAARLALHTGDPGSGSANEVAGGGYARQAVSWNPTAAGIASLVSPASFPVPAVTIAWVSCWNAAGTVRYWKVQLSPALVFGTPGTCNIDGQMDLNA